MFKAHCFLTLVLILHFFSSTPAAQVPWNAITNGQMSMSMPCTGAWETTKEPGSITQIYMCKSGNDTYLASWSEYEPSFKVETAAELKSNRDNLIKGVGAVLLTNSDITYQGLPGLEFTANLKGTYLITSRVVIQGRHPFMLATMTPLNENRADSIQRFFASLRIAK